MRNHFALRLASRLALLAVASLPVLPARAGTEPRLFLDLLEGEAGHPGLPDAVRVAGTRAFFTTTATGAASELWITDGTPVGTRRLGSYPFRLGGMEMLVHPSIGARWIIAPVTANVGREAWTTDGSAAETYLLEDFLPGPRWGLSALLAPIGDRLLLTARDSGGRLLLWSTDGTAGGTSSVGVLAPELANSEVDSWVSLGDEILLILRAFPAEGEGLGRYFLWKTDGTETGTVALTDLGGERPALLEGSGDLFGDRVLFVQPDGRATAVLWSTDGTAEGTGPVTSFDTEAGFALSSKQSRLVGGQLVVFLSKTPAIRSIGVDCELWSTDGTPGGTSKVASLGELAGFPPNEGLVDCPSRLAVVGDRLFFGELRHSTLGVELWQSDGTRDGTVLAIDLAPGPASGNPGDLTSFGGELWFTLFQDSTRDQLFRSDGTAPGTHPFQPLAAVRQLFPMAGRLLVTGGPTTDDQALWSTDGTEEGTQRVFQTRSYAASSWPENLLRLEERLLFSALSLPFGEELWATDGSEQGTRALDATPGGSSTNVIGLHREDRQAYFLGGNITAFTSGELWRSRGTLETTRKLADGVFSPTAVPLGGAVYFSRAEAGELELWRTDGTPRGTSRVKDIFPGLEPHGDCGSEPCRNSSDPRDLLRLGNRLLFTADDGAHGRELWTSDGSQDGTRLVADLNPGPASSSLSGWTRNGDHVFFVGRTNLRVTDGRTSGTRRLTDSTDRLARSYSSPALFRGRIFFLETEDAGQIDPLLRLWSSDGTREGTWPAVDLPFAAALYSPLVVTGSRMFFAAGTEGSGIELWATDGTPAGTHPVRDIAPGPASSFPHNLSAVDGVLLFAASDGISGHELWRSDGTEAGTWPAGEIEPAVGSSTPEGFTPLADQVFFSAFHSDSGRELWTMDRLGIRSSCTPGDGRLCLAGGRYEVVVDWHNPRTGARGTGTSAEHSDDTGFFSFFREANVELLVKMLDGRQRNGRHWLFAGALTDLEYWITVTDFETGRVESFHHPAFDLCGVGETAVFDDLDVTPSTPSSSLVGFSAAGPGIQPFPASGVACPPGAGALLLGKGRFAVEVAWHNQRTGAEGTGTAVPGSEETGYFWFFRPQNLELAVKLLDGTARNGHFWFFFGGLSDLEYEIRVTDTATCRERVYRNPPGQTCGQSDLRAFAASGAPGAP